MNETKNANIINTDALAEKSKGLWSWIKGLATWKKWVGGIAVFILLIVAMSMWATSAIVSSVEKQLNLMRSGDLKGAYELFSNEFKRTTSYNEFLTFLNKYPSLKNNKSHTFTSRKIENGIGSLSGTLEAQDGTVIPIEYTLVKENGEWKVLSIQLKGVGFNSSSSLETTDLQASIADSQNQTDSTKSGQTAALNKTFDSQKLAYSMKYPENRSYQELSGGVHIVFSGPKGSEAEGMLVEIQNVLTKNKGGRFENADALIEDFKKQFKDLDKNASFSPVQEIDLAQNKGETAKARGFLAELNYKGQGRKSLQFFIPNQGIIHVWTFSAPSEKFDKLSPLAESMMKTWTTK